VKCRSVVHDGEAVLSNVVFLHVERLRSRLMFRFGCGSCMEYIG